MALIDGVFKTMIFIWALMGKNHKVRLVRKKAKGWSINIDAANKKRKEDLL
jgi:hypothetical protein